MGDEPTASPLPAPGAHAPSPGTAFLRDIKLEHSLFALPFAFIGALSAVHLERGALDLRLALLVLACMVTARTAAMGFNRWHDAGIDAANPRTAGRAIPSGLLPRRAALAYTAAAAVAFLVLAALINPLCGSLAPLALLVILGYSTAKRWTTLAHLILGLALSLGAGGGWVAVAGTIEIAPAVLMAAVLCWVAGFDILYALMDLEFDRARGLHSIPARFGERGAYAASRALHAASILFLVAFGAAAGLGTGWFAGTSLTAASLVAQQVLARDRTRIPVAFFHLNAGVGFLLLAGLAWDMARG